MRSAARASLSTKCPSRLPLTLAILAALLCASLLTAAPSAAVNVGINIEVFRNGVSQGTAFGGADTVTNTPLVVLALPGDTLRFVVSYNIADNGYYGVDMTADANNSAGGSAEMRFVAGSGVELSGSGFAALASNPNISLNDNTPFMGSARNAPTPPPLGTLLYRVDYLVQAGVVPDGNRDFTGVLTFHQSDPLGNSIDLAKDTASVRIDVATPEPASLLLLASGLAGLGLWSRRRG